MSLKSPVYRAEEHDTTRHLNEYISLNFEMGFIQSMQDLIQCQEGLLRHIFAHLSSVCATELAMYQATVPEITAIPQLTLAQAREILQSQYKWQSASRDLDPEGERLICQHALQEHGSRLVYITNYPSEVRPFYAMKDSSGTGTESFDLLYNGLEITTGGQRIHRYEDLVASIQSRGMKAEEFPHLWPLNTACRPMVDWALVLSVWSNNCLALLLSNKQRCFREESKSPHALVNRLTKASANKLAEPSFIDK